jgi:hypothetical protein
MHIFTRLYQAINIHTEQLKKVAVNSTAAEIKKVNQPIASTSSRKDVLTLIKNNKILTFAAIFVTINLILSFQPLHLKRPEILARNRLEKKVN